MGSFSMILTAPFTKIPMRVRVSSNILNQALLAQIRQDIRYFSEFLGFRGISSDLTKHHLIDFFT